jgi:hypothetical protein
MRLTTMKAPLRMTTWRSQCARYLHFYEAPKGMSGCCQHIYLPRVWVMMVTRDQDTVDERDLASRVANINARILADVMAEEAEEEEVDELVDELEGDGGGGRRWRSGRRQRDIGLKGWDEEDDGDAFPVPLRPRKDVGNVTT